MTIFDKDELKYTQTDIDVRDAKIEELQRKLHEMEVKLRRERARRKMMESSSWGSQRYIDDEYKNIWKEKYSQFENTNLICRKINIY